MLEITKENQNNSISCQMENPVSHEQSDQVSNPLIPDYTSTIIIVTVLLTLVLSILVVSLLVWKFSERIQWLQVELVRWLKEEHGESERYLKLGSTVVLSPGSVTGPITRITWKHGDNLAVEWSGDVRYFSVFEDHCSLNTTSGDLTLSKVTRELSGSYTPEINYIIKAPIQVYVLTPVPKPAVSTLCNDEKTSCVLTCEGIIAGDHGLVNYTWKLGNKSVSGSKIFTITQRNQEDPISCVLGNPVSHQESDKVSNPLITGKADLYGKLGSTVVLSPGLITGPITSIFWKHGADIAVEWAGGGVTCYRQFKDHCSLNTTSGDLTLSKVTHEHSGSYTPEINLSIKAPTKIYVLTPVPKPAVLKLCNDEKTNCVLICEGTITGDHGLVKYSWVLGDSPVPGDKTYKITQENQDDYISCQMENLVSHEESVNLHNQLIPDYTATIIIVTVSVALLILVVSILLWRRHVRNEPKRDSRHSQP